MAETFLHVRTFGNPFPPGRAAAGGHEMDDERTVVAEPFDVSVTAATASPAAASTAAAEANAVDGDAVHLMGLSGCGRSQPQFNAVRESVGESELFTVRAPDGRAQLQAGRAAATLTSPPSEMRLMV